MRTTTSHAASAENSRRLQRVLAILEDGAEHSTYELLHQAQVCAVNSIIHELRQNGHEITCLRHNGRFHYQLAKTGTVPSEVSIANADGTVPAFARPGADGTVPAFARSAAS